MSAMTFGQKSFTPTAPEKGSFPLDRENVCKNFMVEYMFCLKDNGRVNEKCRREAQQYFKCRMEHNLMDKQEWDKLGYADLTVEDGKGN